MAEGEYEDLVAESSEIYLVKQSGALAQQLRQHVQLFNNLIVQ